MQRYRDEIDTLRIERDQWKHKARSEAAAARHREARARAAALEEAARECDTLFEATTVEKDTWADACIACGDNIRALKDTNNETP